MSSRFSFLFSVVFGVLCLSGIVFYYQNMESLQIETVSTVPPDLANLQSRCISQDYFDNVRKALDNELSRIWNEWDVSSYPLFLSFIDVPANSWKMQKHKFIALLLDYQKSSNLHQRNSFTSTGRNKYVMGFSGSSVTAGHDSFFAEAYPQIVYNALNPVFSAAEIDLEVRNQALGNNPCYPYDACVATHMGNDLDFLSWEQSMNCGRSSRPLETFTRSALRMHRTPTVMYIASGTPQWNENDCANSSSSLPWKPSTAEKLLLSTPLQKTAQSSSILRESSYLKAPNGKYLLDTYKGVGAMGQNVLGLQAYKCQGPYNSQFCKKTPGGGAPWHPGKLGHKLRGENIAYFLLKIFDDALREVEKVVEPSCDTNVVSLDTSAATAPFPAMDPGSSLRRRLQATSGNNLLFNSLNFLRVAIDKSPLQKPPLSCLSSECDSEAFCFTDYLPRVGNNTLTSIISPRSNSELNQSEKKLQFSSAGNISAIINNQSWALELSFFDVNAVRKAEAKNLGYLDRKYIYVSHGEGASISFSVDVTRKSPIWLCECQKGFLKYPETMADLDVGATVYTESSGGLVSIAIRPLIDQCYATAPVPAGRHTLTVVQKGVKQINLAYLLHW